ncbi:MAG: hypothetical protein WBM08_00280 [Prochlorococcaceae cyanobacterium]
MARNREGSWAFQTPVIQAMFWQEWNERKSKVVGLNLFFLLVMAIEQARN